MRDIKDIEAYAKEHDIPIMEGIGFLVDYIRDNNIKTILEIGTAIGYSAIKMASINDEITVTSIEKDMSRYELACDNIKSFSNRITLIYGDALETNIDGEYDLIFIDAAKSQYINFFEKFKNNLSSNGVIISDNLSFHGIVADPSITKSRNTRQLVNKIQKYIDYLKKNEEFVTEFYSVGDGISVSYKKKD